MDIQELKNLCITAYEKQMLALVHAEGEDIKLLGALKGELKEVSNHLFYSFVYLFICFLDDNILSV